MEDGSNSTTRSNAFSSCQTVSRRQSLQRDAAVGTGRIAWSEVAARCMLIPTRTRPLPESWRDLIRVAASRLNGRAEFVAMIKRHGPLRRKP